MFTIKSVKNIYLIKSIENDIFLPRLILYTKHQTEWSKSKIIHI